MNFTGRVLMVESVMLSQSKRYACALLVVIAMNQPSHMRILEQSNNIPIPPVIESASQSDKFSEIVYLHSAAVSPLPRSSMRSTEALLVEIGHWLSANFDLPAADDPPRIEFASPMKLTMMRYQGLLPSDWHENNANSSSMHLTPGRDVIALYHDPTRTIFLSDDWTGANLAEISVLVHEMVHHLQNLAGVKFECLAAKEKLAYLAQDQWLQLRGSSLEKEFEIDKFTVMINSACLS